MRTILIYRTCLFVLSLLIGGCLLPSKAMSDDDALAAVAAREGVSGVRKDMLSNDKDIQERAIAAVREERVQNIRLLRPVLFEAVNEKNRNRVASAIKFAGIERISELAGDIVKKIDFLEYGRITGTRPSDIRTDYIAVDTLIRIGKPAIAPTLKRLSIETEPLIRSMLVRVIQDVEGKEIGTLLLHKEIQQAKEQKKQNLQEGLRLLQQTDDVKN